MSYAITVTGGDKLRDNLETIARRHKSISWAAVRAGLRVFARAAKSPTRGSIRNEVGLIRVKPDGDTVTGSAGFKRYPRRGDGQNGPHGVYLEHGTKFIAADHAVANALAGSRGAAAAAMMAAAEKKIEQLAASSK